MVFQRIKNALVGGLFRARASVESVQASVFATEDFPAPKRRVFAGIPVMVENPKGSVRSGVSGSGKAWAVKMNHDYGFISRHNGEDGEGLDVLIGPDPTAKDVHVIHQNNPETGQYDEDKVVLGARSPEEAKIIYLSNYDTPDFYRSCTVIPLDSFKEMLTRGEPGGARWKKKMGRGHETTALFATNPPGYDGPGYTIRNTQNIPYDRFNDLISHGHGRHYCSCGNLMGQCKCNGCGIEYHHEAGGRKCRDCGGVDFDAQPETAGAWRTLHGAHVFIEDGKITKGPHGMVGQSPDAVKSHAPAREGYTHAVRDEKGGFHHPEPSEHARIKALRLPPAWSGVQLSVDPTAKLQATGIDSKGRTQYRYSTEHSGEAAAAKFTRVKQFVAKLPEIRAALAKDKSEEASVLRLIDATGLRIGGEGDPKADKQAYGAATLEKRHVQIKGDKTLLNFVGKKGVRIKQEITDPAVAAELRRRAGGDEAWRANSKVKETMFRGTSRNTLHPYNDKSLVFLSPTEKFASVYGKVRAVQVNAEHPFDASRGEGYALWKQFKEETKQPGYATGGTDRGALPFWTIEHDLRKWLDAKGVKYDSIWFAENDGSASLAVRSMDQIREDDPKAKLFSTSDAKVRDRLHELAPGFKVKDFRTAVAADTALTAIKHHPSPNGIKEYVDAVTAVATVVSDKLGNTPTIALASYIPPEVFSAWRSKVANAEQADIIGQYAKQKNLPLETAAKEWIANHAGEYRKQFDQRAKSKRPKPVNLAQLGFAGTDGDGELRSGTHQPPAGRRSGRMTAFGAETQEPLMQYSDLLAKLRNRQNPQQSQPAPAAAPNPRPVPSNRTVLSDFGGSEGSRAVRPPQSGLNQRQTPAPAPQTAPPPAQNPPAAPPAVNPQRTQPAPAQSGQPPAAGNPASPLDATATPIPNATATTANPAGGQAPNNAQHPPQTAQAGTCPCCGRPMEAVQTQPAPGGLTGLPQYPTQPAGQLPQSPQSAPIPLCQSLPVEQAQPIPVIPPPLTPEQQAAQKAANQPPGQPAQPGQPGQGQPQQSNGTAEPNNPPQQQTDGPNGNQLPNRQPSNPGNNQPGKPEENRQPPVETGA